MATRIVQVDLAKPILPVGGLSGYGRVWLLIRHGRRPLGWVKFSRTFVGQEVRPETICDLIADHLVLPTWNSLRAGPLPALSHLPTASVIVCTRDHPDQLRRQLQSLARQEHPNYEVVVVDNAPRNDGTRQVCEEFSFVRYVLEPEPGLDYARNTGWRAAKNEIVAYTDDDACVDPFWLATICDAYADPRVHCVTGLTLPFELETPAQEYFELYGGMQKGFRRRVYHPANWRTYFPLGSGHFGCGVNLSLRRSFLESLGGFDNALDTGSLTRGGGDLDIMARVLQAGGSLVYEPCALVHHQHRKTMPQLQRQMFDYGYGFFAYLAKFAGGDLELQNYAVRLMKDWLKIWGWRRLKTNFKAAVRLRPHFPINLIVREMAGMLLGPKSYKRAVQRVRTRAYLRKSRAAAS